MPASEVHLEPLRFHDAEQLLKLQFLCYQSEAALYDDYNIAPLKQPLTDLLSDLNTHTVLGAYLGDELVGSVRAQDRTDGVHLGRLIVHPRLQGQGLGSRLLHGVEAACMGAQRFELFTGHRSEGNLRLYRRLGYVEFKREVTSPALTLVYLEKVI